MYSYFRRTGLLDVDRTLNDARTEEYAGILIPGGAKSPALLADDARARAFVQEVDRRGMMVACICRGALLPVVAGIARGRRITGFNDAAAYPALVVGPHAIEAGALWIDGEPVVRDGRLVSSPHPDFSDVFGAEMVRVLSEQADVAGSEDVAMEEQFEFTSDREHLIGRLHLPEGAPHAAVVTTGPLTSVKEQATRAYAKALAQRGYVALAFDHRYFGESGGSPRQFESPAAKIADIRAAVAALQAARTTRTLPIVAVGVCARARATWRAPSLRRRLSLRLRRRRRLLRRDHGSFAQERCASHRARLRRRAGLARNRRRRDDSRGGAGRRRCGNAAARGI